MSKFETFRVDLEAKFPEIAKEWHMEKNGDLLPSRVKASSNLKVWWKCKHGHEWQARIADRTKKHTGCAVCSNHKLLTGFNDLATEFPDIALEWNYEKNGDLLPTQVVSGSGKEVWWKCKKGHEWKVSVNTRVNKGNNCPYCQNRRVLVGYNDLATTNPELAEEWNYEKNGELRPTMITHGSGKKVWWKCKYGHEWQATLNARSEGNECPVCKAELRLAKKRR